MGWKDFGDDDDDAQDDRPAITLGDLRSGEGVTLTVDDEPEEFESDEYGPGVRVPATFHESDYAHKHEGEAVREGDRVVLLTWSSRLVRALVRADEDLIDGIVGETVAITKSGSGYDTEYTVEPVSAAEA